jgi:hypothetical protein
MASNMRPASRPTAHRCFIEPEIQRGPGFRGQDSGDEVLLLTSIPFRRLLNIHSPGRSHASFP